MADLGDVEQVIDLLSAFAESVTERDDFAVSV
jgi:hypothetical protein